MRLEICFYLILACIGTSTSGRRALALVEKKNVADGVIQVEIKDENENEPRIAINKRNFFDIFNGCKGNFDKEVFAQLERVCEDCFNLYQDPQLYRICRLNCFGSEYFKGCLDALLLDDEDNQYEEMIEILGRK